MESNEQIDQEFFIRISCIRAVIEKTGSDHGLGTELGEWVVEKYGRYYWPWCERKLSQNRIDGAVTMLSERMGEWGM